MVVEKVKVARNMDFPYCPDEPGSSARWAHGGFAQRGMQVVDLMQEGGKQGRPVTWRGEGLQQRGGPHAFLQHEPCAVYCRAPSQDVFTGGLAELTEMARPKTTDELRSVVNWCSGRLLPGVPSPLKKPRVEVHANHVGPRPRRVPTERGAAICAPSQGWLLMTGSAPRPPRLATAT